MNFSKCKLCQQPDNSQFVCAKNIIAIYVIL